MSVSRQGCHDYLEYRLRKVQGVQIEKYPLALGQVVLEYECVMSA